LPWACVCSSASGVAESVLSKVTLVVPDLLREYLRAPPVYVLKSGAPVPARRDLPTLIRHAIRDSGKMRIDYQDEAGRRTERVIQPFAVAYYVEATLVCAWCELRNESGTFEPTASSRRPYSMSRSRFQMQ